MTCHFFFVEMFEFLCFRGSAVNDDSPRKLRRKNTFLKKGNPFRKHLGDVDEAPKEDGLREKQMAVEEQQQPGTEVVVDRTAKKSAVAALVASIQSEDGESVKRAMIELRLLSKWEMKNRIMIAEAGGIPTIVALLRSLDSKVQENAVTSLLNLSIHADNRKAIMEAPSALNCLAEVLKNGATAESKENAAALLASLLIVEKYRDVVGRYSSLVLSLIHLLKTGGYQSKKDCIKALFHLALWPENRRRLTIAGTVPVLLAILKTPRGGLIEDSFTLLAQIAKCKEGTEAATKGPTMMKFYVEYLKNGGRLAKENVTSLLLILCQTGGTPVQVQVRVHKNAIVGVLLTMLASGSPRGQGKAKELMQFMLICDGEIVDATDATG